MKFQVYKVLRIQIKSKKRKKIMFGTEPRMFIFSYGYSTMKPKVTLRLFSAVHYENTPIQIYRRFHLQKLKENHKKKRYFFHISAQNIDCGYSLGVSNEYPQSMFSSKTKKNNVYPCKPQFYYIKVGFKGVNIIQTCFRDDWSLPWFTA